MATELPYLTDPLTLEFEARVIQKRSLGNGRFDVILESTYFYPTGGGQQHDTGRLGQAAVVDVFRDDAGKVIHRLKGDISGPVVTARIDHDRRLGHMQHHSGQHMLSAALAQTLNLDTLSAKISADSPSTIDLPDVDLARPDLKRVERQVNQVVFEDRPIKTYFIADNQLETVPFRRLPKVSGQIRVVEIEGFDYSACGATHCPRTGMVGLIKIVKTERKNNKLRLHFVAGQQALAHFQHDHQLVTDLCRRFSTGPQDLLSVLERQAEQLAEAQQENKRLKADIAAFETRQLIDQAESFETCRWVTKVYPDRSMAEVRDLARQLQAQDRLVALLAGYDGQKLGLVVGCGQGTNLSARTLLSLHLEPIGGKGGGDDQLAQGGGSATPAQVAQLFDSTREYLKASQLSSKDI